MKVTRRRSALSQSVDALLIVATTIAIGSMVYGFATGLIGSAAQSNAIQITSAGLNVGTNGASFSIVVKDAGNQQLTGAAVVKITGVTVPIGTTVPTPSGSVVWVGSTDATSSVAGTYYQFAASSVTLAAGSSLSLAEGFTGSTGFTAGNVYTVLITVGSSSYSLSLTAVSA